MPIYTTTSIIGTYPIRHLHATSHTKAPQKAKIFISLTVARLRAMPCHAYLQMAVHEETRAKKKKLAKQQPLVAFATSAGPSRMLCCRQAPQLGIIASVTLLLWAAASSDLR